MDINTLCNTVREVSYAIHVYHGPGHVERIYENALVHRLTKLGFRVEQQKPISVLDEDGAPIGFYVADLVVDGRLLIELKAVRRIAPEHVAQVLGYLKSTRLEFALLLNFGDRVFGARRYAGSALWMR